MWLSNLLRPNNIPSGVLLNAQTFWANRLCSSFRIRTPQLSTIVSGTVVSNVPGLQAQLPAPSACSGRSALYCAIPNLYGPSGLVLPNQRMQPTSTHFPIELFRVRCRDCDAVDAVAPGEPGIRFHLQLRPGYGRPSAGQGKLRAVSPSAAKQLVATKSFSARPFNGSALTSWTIFRCIIYPQCSAISPTVSVTCRNLSNRSSYPHRTR